MKKNLEKIIKFLKKKRKGFTLVELLGAIVILGILSTIAIVSLTKVLESSHKKYYDTQVKLLQAAGQTYFSDHKDLLPTINFGINQVDLGTLIDQGYINEIVDYNKEECYKDKSYVTVTRRGPSSYVYQAFLSCKNRKTQTYVDGKDSTAGIDLQYGTIDSNNGNLIGSIYYVRGTLNLNLNITASNSIGDNSGVTGYSYTLIKVNQNNSKKDYKTSEIIPSDANSICTEYSGDKCRKITDTIKIRAKDIKDGKYIIKIKAYNLVGKDNSKIFDTYSIIIDKTKPKCNITLPTKTNENFVNGWYNGKASNGSIAFTDAYLSNYDITNNSNPTYNNSISGTSGTRPITLTDTTTSGQTFYGYVKDIAGNVGTCKTDVIKVDKSSPTCSVDTTTSSNSRGWFTNIPTIKLSDTTNDNGYSGINSYGLSTTANTYNNSYTNSQGETKGQIWYGIIKDNAGNVNTCNSGSIKVDTSKPSCTNTKNYTTWTAGSRTVTYGCDDSISGCTGGGTDTVSDLVTYSKTYTVTNGAGLTNNCTANVYIYSDTKTPTIGISGNKASSWYSTKVSGKFRLTVTLGNIGVSGAKLYGKWESDDNYTFIKDITGVSNDIYTTDEFSANRDEENRYYKVVSGANQPNSDHVNMKIDNDTPTVKWCKRDAKSVCGTGTYSHIIVPYVEDNLSGYKNGYFDWVVGRTWPTPARNITGYSECIGSSTASASQSITYIVCDIAGNCTDQKTKSGSSINTTCTCSGNSDFYCEKKE